MTREYYFNQRWQDVIDSAEKMLECKNAWDVEQAAVCRWAGEASHQLGKEEDARTWYDKGKDILPSQGEPWYGIAIDAYRKQEWSRCLDACINVIEHARSIHYCYESAIWDWKAYDLGSISAYNLKQYPEALAFAKEAGKANGPEQERIQRNIDFFEKVVNELQSRTKNS